MMVNGDYAAHMSQVSFRDAFCASLLMDASAYFAVPLDGTQHPNQEELTIGENARLEGYQLQCHRKGLCDIDFREWQVGFAVVNCRQSSDFMGINCKVLPAILCKAKLYDLVNDDVIHVARHWLGHGFAHPAVSSLPDGLKATFPFADLVRRTSPCQGSSTDSISSSTIASAGLLPGSKQRRLVGNSMHLGVVACAIAYLLACTSK